jgi:hypothetical protein
MAVYNLAIWAPADFGITAGNYRFLRTPLTLRADASPDVVRIDDTDAQGTTFNDGVPGDTTSLPEQFLTGTVNGRSYAGVTANPEIGGTAFVNGVAVGNVYWVTRTNSGSFASFIGIAADFELQPGTTYSIRWDVAAPAPGAGSLFVCFTPGTMIAVPGGERPVESLRPGDPVLTLDRGAQLLRWTGRRDFSAAEVAASPSLRPVVIAAGALGQAKPAREMRVSQLHRFLIRDDTAELMFGCTDVLLAARDMVDGLSVRLDDAARGASFVHLMLDRHEILIADGCAAESFHPNSFSLGALDDEVRAEILAIFPELSGSERGWQPARAVLKRHEAEALPRTARLRSPRIAVH